MSNLDSALVSPPSLGERHGTNLWDRLGFQFLPTPHGQHNKNVGPKMAWVPCAKYQPEGGFPPIWRNSHVTPLHPDDQRMELAVVLRTFTNVSGQSETNIGKAASETSMLPFDWKHQEARRPCLRQAKVDSRAALRCPLRVRNGQSLAAVSSLS